MITVDPLVFSVDHLDPIRAGTKTQMRIPLVPDEGCPLEPLRPEVPFFMSGIEAGKVRILDVSRATVYGITLADAIAEGFPSAVKFNEWWAVTHGPLDGHCWRVVFELVVDLTDQERQVIETIYGVDGKQPLFWQARPGTKDGEFAHALVGRHLIMFDRTFPGYVLAPLGRRVARSLKAGRPT